MDEHNGEAAAKLHEDAALRRRLARALLATAAVLLAGVAWAGVAASSPGETSAAGQAVPAFELPLLSGGHADHHALDGQVTVINFWASWCPPCRSEAPILRAVAQDTEEHGVRFLGVLHNDRPEPAGEFVERFGLDFPTAIDDGSLARALGVRSIPVTFIVDASGHITARHFGPISETRLRVLIEDARSVTPHQAGGS